MGGEPALASEQRERIALRSWQHRSGEESRRGRFWMPRRWAATLNGTASNSMRPNDTAPRAEAAAPWRVA